MCGIEGKSATPSLDPPPLTSPHRWACLCAQKEEGEKEKMAKIKAIFYPKSKCLGGIYVQQVHISESKAFKVGPMRRELPCCVNSLPMRHADHTRRPKTLAIETTPPPPPPPPPRPPFRPLS